MVGEVKIGIAERIKGRDRVRLKGNDETESLRAPEQASNRQKNTISPFSYFFPRAAAAAPPPQSELRDGIGCVL